MAPAAKRKLTHIDQRGNARMVDVGAKPATERVAIAKGEVHMMPATLALLRAGNLKKGDVFSVAQVAGVLAAKRTSDLIPLCHPLPLTQGDVQMRGQCRRLCAWRAAGHRRKQANFCARRDCVGCKRKLTVDGHQSAGQCGLQFRQAHGQQIF